MQIDENKRARAALKTYFAKNAIPTEAQFAQLIDSNLNQRDDGFVKNPGDPLSIEATGDDVGMKKALSFYMSFADADPAWSVSLKPRARANDPATARTGWSIIDAGGNSRLAIDAANGNVGIGTVQPGEKLEVTGRIKAGSLTVGAWPANPGQYVFFGSNTLDQGSAGNYALLQSVGGGDAGATFVNSPRSVSVRINNGNRLVVEPDKTQVENELWLSNSDLYFTDPNHNHTGRGNTPGHAAIENAKDYGSLMILGRSNPSAGALNRLVRLWDRLEVKGTFDVLSDVSLNGKHAFRSSDSWLRLNQDRHFPSGTHTPGVFAPGSLNVGGMNGWGNPGDGNVWVTGNLLVAGRIGAMGKGPQALTNGWHGGMRTFDLEAEATIWARWGVQTGPRDLAEIYFSADALEPGDVVCLTEEENGIAPTGTVGDPRVIGIVSSEPGLLLGSQREVPEREDGRAGHPVALLGCVPCKVTDEGGPIRCGDLLTPSSLPAHAMRASAGAHSPGTIIGKALAPHAAGTGKIDVFVMLR
jgi:hypothetical protein